MSDPTKVPNLLYRWRADSVAQANGSAVASWPALTGNVALAQTNTADQPTYVTSAIGGQPAVRFTASQTQSLRAAVTSRTQPVSVVVVHKLNTLSDSIRQLVDASGLQIITLAPGYDAWAGNDLAGGTANTNPRVLTFVVNGASSAFFLDGTQAASGDAGAGSLGSTLTIGNHGSVARWLDGDVAEVLIYGGALSAADRSTVHTYVKERYGITVSDAASTTPTNPPTTTAVPFAVNVFDYGAKGDGTTDDTAAIRSALASGAGRVVLPGRTYSVRGSLTVPTGVLLEGASKYGTVLQHDFSGDFVYLESYSGLRDLTLRGQGASHGGRGVVIANGTHQQYIQNVAINAFDGPCIYFGLNGGSQFRGTGIDAYRVNAGSGSDRYAIVVENGFQDSAVPRSFVQLETQGTCAIDFGGCNDFYLVASTFADLLFRPDTRGLNIIGSRWLNQPSATIHGHGVTILGNDILPQLTIASGTSLISVGPNAYNRLPVTNNNSNVNSRINVITYPGF